MKYVTEGKRQTNILSNAGEQKKKMRRGLPTWLDKLRKMYVKGTHTY